MFTFKHFFLLNFHCLTYSALSHPYHPVVWKGFTEERMFAHKLVEKMLKEQRSVPSPAQHERTSGQPKCKGTNLCHMRLNLEMSRTFFCICSFKGDTWAPATEAGKSMSQGTSKRAKLFYGTAKSSIIDQSGGTNEIHCLKESAKAKIVLSHFAKLYLSHQSITLSSE